MKITEIESWKSTQISSMTTLINNSISAHQSPFYDKWDGFNSEAIVPVTNYINSLSFNRTLTSPEIKKQILTVYTYISIKYLSIIKDSGIASQFNVPSIIDGTLLYPNEDDFRNIFIESKDLPELDLSYFDFVATPDIIEGGPIPDPMTYTYSVSATSVYNTLNTNLGTTWAKQELDFWQGLPDKVQTQDKILYIMFNTPEMRIPLPEEPNNAKDILLYTMHFKDAIKDTIFVSDFTNIFPELLV